MKGLKNLPIDNPKKLGDLINYEKNQVVSMSLSNSEYSHMMLFSFPEGEMLEEEKYPLNTLYLAVEGEVIIKQGDKINILKEGEVFMVPADVFHEIGGKKAFKLLQINI